MYPYKQKFIVLKIWANQHLKLVQRCSKFQKTQSFWEPDGQSASNINMDHLSRDGSGQKTGLPHLSKVEHDLLSDAIAD